jgi:hypothetical protein
MKRLIAMTLTVLPLALVLACSAQAKQEEARDTYAAQQMLCVEKYRSKEFKTIAEMDACRAAVKELWGRDAGAKDGAQ